MESSFKMLSEIFTSFDHSLCFQITNLDIRNLRMRILPSDISRSRISQANIVGFSLLYCSIFDTTAGVATFGFDPPISPGGLSVPERHQN